MIPITAAPPTRAIPQNVVSSQSLPSLTSNTHSLTRSVSLPAMPSRKPYPLDGQTTTPSARPRPAFHLAVDGSDPEEDTRLHNLDSSDPDTAAAPPMPEHLFAERDSARRFHALSELLSTELGYLLDLRILVSVYLRLLPVLKNRSTLPLSHASSSNPTISYFTRPSSVHLPHSVSFRTQSHPHFNAAILTYPAESHPAGSGLPHPVPARVEKCTTRHLFSASDLDTITRNAEDILEFHERLVHQLRQVVSPLGISMTTREFPAENSVQSHLNSPIDVHHVINAVSAVFLDHAPGFDQYQSFCSGHSEAFDLVRKVQHRYPAEWDAFELRCAAVAAEVLLPDVAGGFIQSSESGIQVLDPSKRRHSFSSLDAASSESLRVPVLSASESGHTDKDTSSRKPRLMFMDYMIKPVQRVCKYPLLFDQLQERTAQQRFGSDPSSISRGSQDAVKTALWTMRNVASLVDEARRQQELFAKSVQIVSRITQGLLTSVASNNRPPQAVLLSAFLSTLGPCHLSGSLDVIHYRGTNMARVGTVRAKYLGAFLFPGGFLVLAKVAKSKAYEPKYWFNLRGFELVDSNLDDVLLPSWFRLSSKAHMFEFAASCRREKDIWVDAIRRAVAEVMPWIDEPPSSLQAEYIASLPEDVQFETITPLPTIQSLPELDDVESAIPNSGNPALPQICPPAENAAKDDIAVPPVPSRRSSVAIHSASMPESNTFHLVRPTASAKEQVDRGLLDIFSEKCLTARFHAHAHEEDLFEARRVTRSFTRSTSALTMASAMSVAAKNRLTKRESVLVPRKRSFLEGSGMLGDMEVTPSHSVAPKPVKMRQPPKELKIVAITKPSFQQGDEDGNELCLDSPSPMSHCSSVSFVTPPTPLTTVAALSTPSCRTESVQSHSVFLNVRKDYVPKRSKSMIDNVRGFFVSRSVSPTPALSRESSTKSSISNSGLFKWWSRELPRQRVQSAPDVTCEELPTARTTKSLHLETPPPLVTTDRRYSQPDLHYLYSETAELSVTEFGVDTSSSRKKSLFSSRGVQRRWSTFPLSSERDDDSTPVPTRIRRNLSFLQRFTHGTRGYDDIDPHDRP